MSVDELIAMRVMADMACKPDDGSTFNPHAEPASATGPPPEPGTGGHLSTTGQPLGADPIRRSPFCASAAADLFDEAGRR
jgi:hypothetical protein